MFAGYRKADVYIQGILAGVLSETDNGSEFCYEEGYLSGNNPLAVCATLPLRA